MDQEIIEQKELDEIKQRAIEIVKNNEDKFIAVSEEIDSVVAKYKNIFDQEFDALNVWLESESNGKSDDEQSKLRSEYRIKFDALKQNIDKQVKGDIGKIIINISS